MKIKYKQDGFIRETNTDVNPIKSVRKTFRGFVVDLEYIENVKVVEYNNQKLTFPHYLFKKDI